MQLLLKHKRYDLLCRYGGKDIRGRTPQLEKVAEVEAALERNGLHIIRRREQNGWVSLAAKRA